MSNVNFNEQKKSNHSMVDDFNSCHSDLLSSKSDNLLYDFLEENKINFLMKSREKVMKKVIPTFFFFLIVYSILIKYQMAEKNSIIFIGFVLFCSLIFVSKLLDSLFGEDNIFEKFINFIFAIQPMEKKNQKIKLEIIKLMQTDKAKHSVKAFLESSSIHKLSIKEKQQVHQFATEQVNNEITFKSFDNFYKVLQKQDDFINFKSLAKKYKDSLAKEKTIDFYKNIN